MKRANIGSALIAAPLIITGSLFAGSAAMADQSQFIALQEDGGCVVSSTGMAYFGFENKNDVEVDVQFHNLDNGATGTIQVLPNSDYYYAVPYDVNNNNNTTVFTAQGWTSPVSTNASVHTECVGQFQMAPTGGNTGNGGGSTGSTGGDTSTPGKGGDSTTTAPTTTTSSVATPAAANTAATLADTGASQILPYTAAALIAVATLGMTVAVRKNVL